ncbi:MAG: cytochrome c oxidase assembly protein [Nocardioidaceae bacterium]
MTFVAHADQTDNVPALTVERIFTAWTFEPLPLLLIMVTGGLYIAGVRALHRRGDAWSMWRTTSFVVPGLGSLVVATQSALATYDTTLLSVHMVQHMILSMVAPVFMALGAPVTLALRTLPGRPRRWLLTVLHSKVAAVVASPPVAFVLFVFSPWVLYFSGIYEATLDSDLLHEWMHLHFIVVGCLFFWPLLGLDPVPGRVAYPFRVLTVFATLPFHAFLGVTIMTMNGLIAEEWYRGLGRTWAPTPEDDQRIAGGILWGSGDIIALVIFGLLFAQWVRQSQAEARREDRRLDREEAAAEAAAAARRREDAPDGSRPAPQP